MSDETIGKGRWAGAIALLSLSSLFAVLLLAALSNGRVVAAGIMGAGALLLTSLAGRALGGEEEDEARRWGDGGRRWSLSDDDFEDLVREVELRATAPAAQAPAPVEDEFAAALTDAIDGLPDWVREELGRNVSVLVSDDGAHGDRYGHPGDLYGLYHPSETAVSHRTGARIVVFRDTLLRDFGHDPAELRAQIAQTLRHEVAHHFGADERHVGQLGL